MNEESSEFELQQDLQRFTTSFVDRVTQATEVLERSARPGVAEEALRKNLLYASAATEIASAPFARLNLLDMTVFVRLCRAALEKHWIPEMYGDSGRELSDAFALADRELDDLATRSLNAEQRVQLGTLVEDWLAENPRQVRVEGIRLSDFSAVAGHVAADRGRRAKGLLASVRGATQAANQAMMLSERGLFLMHRMPTLVRLQARLAAREMLGDVEHAVVTRLRGKVRPALRVAGLSLGLTGGAAVGLWWMASRARKRRSSFRMR